MKGHGVLFCWQLFVKVHETPQFFLARAFSARVSLVSVYDAPPTQKYAFARETFSTDFENTVPSASLSETLPLFEKENLSLVPSTLQGNRFVRLDPYERHLNVFARALLRILEKQPIMHSAF